MWPGSDCKSSRPKDTVEYDEPEEQTQARGEGARRVHLQRKRNSAIESEVEGVEMTDAECLRLLCSSVAFFDTLKYRCLGAGKSRSGRRLWNRSRSAVKKWTRSTGNGFFTSTLPAIRRAMHRICSIPLTGPGDIC